MTGTTYTPVWLGIGANLGDRHATIERALTLLEPDCGPINRSPVYETPPWGDPDQPHFLNVVAAGASRLGPLALLQRCKEIERTLGRQQTHRWGPRAIDIDLLAYGDSWLRVSGLEVPHPRMHERAFVLIPFVDVSPNWRHPLLAVDAATMLARLLASETNGIRRWTAPRAKTRPQLPAEREE